MLAIMQIKVSTPFNILTATIVFFSPLRKQFRTVALATSENAPLPMILIMVTSSGFISHLIVEGLRGIEIPTLG